jgi:prepilin-type N-terminal cleavage/methylation domain-containing protein
MARRKPTQLNPTAARRESRGNYSHPPGYTLTELIIVLSIIVAILAFAWPSLRGGFAKKGLRYAAKYLRAELAEARLQAIRTGTPWEFRFEPGGSRFLVLPRGAGEHGGDWSHGGSRQTPLSGGRSQPEVPSELSQTDLTWSRHGFLLGQLPEGVTFALQQEGFISPELGQELEVGTGSFDLSVLGADAVEVGQEGSSGTEFAETSLEEPSGLPHRLEFADSWESILFLPSGRIASNRLIYLRDAKGNSLPVLLRAVTGTAMIGEPGSSAQLTLANRASNLPSPLGE